jgi:DNA-binding winged helix-turn-helix (wHTH) protein/tetratricopeptide (TPR) repeat protein
MIENEVKKIVFAEFTFNAEGNLLFLRETVVPLEPIAARVLRYFLENDDRIITKEELLDAIWSDVFTTEDVLKRAVSQIRRALGDDPQKPRFIETHHRRGYRFIARNKSEKPSSKSIAPQSSEKTRNVKIDDPNFDCFVGRATETEFLHAEFRRVLKGTGQPILIAGEPGIGKTQLTVRFADWLKNNEEISAVSLRVRFFDYEASHLPPLEVFSDLLAEACEIILNVPENLGASPKIEKSALRRLIETQLRVTLPEELFATSIERRQTAADASHAIAPLAECFARLSRIRPLVLIFDDIQWADESSRQIIGYLMRIAANTPLMLVGLTRRGDAENPQKSFRQWIETQSVYRSFTTLSLSPLSAEDCKNLIIQIFNNQIDDKEISTKDLKKLLEATGGNPYFLVETIRLLLNENLIERNENGWHWHGIGDVPLPETVRMAARAKLTNLSAEARKLIECAAVLGDTFQLETLEIMAQSENSHDADFEKCLDEAIDEQVLTEQNVAGADDCQFYHTTLRRAVYADLSPRRRKRLHARAFQAIEKSHSAEIGRVAAARAAHAENAGDYDASFKWNLQASRAAAARFDWAEAAELLSRAERVRQNREKIEKISDEENLKFLALRGEIYMSVGRRAEAEKIFNEAAALAEVIKIVPDEYANILLNFGRTRILLGKYRSAIPVLEKSLIFAEESGDRFYVSASLIQLASAKYALCEYEESSEILQKIIAEEDSTSYNRAVALGKLGWLRALQSRYEDGKRLLVEALRFHKTAGDLRERAVLAMCLNWCEYGLGEYEAAIKSAMLARSEAQVVGEPYNESVAMMRIAKSRLAQGLYAEAECLLNEVWEKQKDLDAPHAQAETIWMRGRTNIALGNFDKAAEDLGKSLEMILSVGDRDDEFRISIDQAYLQIGLERFVEALNLAERAGTIAAEINISEGIGEALIAKTYALIGLENYDEATDCAREAVQRLEEFNSGEHWRALYALFLAENSKANNSDKDFSVQTETSLRRAIELLERISQQFSAEDDSRRKQFISARSAPAKDLYNLLFSQNRLSEAEQIGQFWLSD